jgi:hypothetical protein
MKTDKEFKCVDFKHQAQKGIYREIQHLTPEGEIQYFHRKVEAGVFGKMWKDLHGALAATGGHDKGSA